DPAWRIANFDLVRDTPKVRATFRANGVDAPPADLSPFRQRGGRLILYHGWADAGVNPLGSIRWRDAVARRMGRRAA
ncbi:tannase/feruloyl esterase family alpha/beta hydrolase, partial [Salmonella enterica subsp. enterica serovar Typhimurium]|nr:tannase/feruloyl esterase family alpha/beta hydrolase [Salmonella enterica subsp. enterica serovar Typhimurium]